MHAINFLKKSQFWLFIIFSCYFSLIPHPTDILEKASDKLLHAAGYFLLFVSCDIAYRNHSRLAGRISVLFTFSLTMEILQHFIPNRHFSLLDLLANIAGLSAASIVMLLLRKTIKS